MAELSLAAQFELKRMKDALPGLGKEELIKLIIQSMRLVKVKAQVHDKIKEQGWDLPNDEFHKCLGLSTESQFNLALNEQNFKGFDEEYLRGVLSNYVELLLKLDAEIRDAFKEAMPEI